jgi:class 3 adenylate cyclase/tetratricopeptide (TPR) repeat protein
MHDKDIEALRAAIAALEGQRATLGDAVLELAVSPLRARLAQLLRPAGLQRRQITVLFADVVGSTALAQGLDAEDTLALLSAALRRMADVVLAHGGRVLRFTGDGVKAAFGMDEAREDDAERAVRAGLAMLAAGREQAELAQRQHGIADFAVRVGVHTGDVALGAGVEADNTAMGAAVNIAARMEQSAPPGALRISHDTWSQVRGLFELEAQPPLLVKGIDAPMQTYLVRGALDRSAASVERGLAGLVTPMVGRDAELQRLRDTVASARDTRQLQALTLLGDAGLGKSRLVRELTSQLIDCLVLNLRSQPDGQLRPWGLLRSLLATQFSVADTDSAEVARRKVVDGLGPWLGEQGERLAQLIGQLSGLDFGGSPHIRGLDPRALRDQAFAALRAYLAALAAQGALPVLIVEDLHWADDGSLELLQHLQAHAAELPMALLMTSRPALLERQPTWCTPQTMRRLSPLAAQDSEQLVQALLQRLEGVPQALADLVANRAEGNPYYMEELVRRLIDEGVIVVGDARWTVQTDRLDAVRLPTTLVGLLQARLDALPAGQRRAARQASIVGHVFWDDALQALDAHAPQALPALQRAAFVRSHDTSDFEGTPERQFDHHLLHQVTYDTLLKAERKLGHGAAARWLAERTRGRGAEFLAMTGEHAERAGDTALAIDCFDEAAKEARKRYANSAAVAWLRRTLALLQEADPARRFGLLDRLLTIADTAGDRAAQAGVLAEMAVLVERHPDPARLARLRYSQALLAERTSDFVESERLSREAFELAAASQAAETAACAQGNRAWLHLARQRHAEAVEPLETGLAWARRIEQAETRAEIEAKLLMLSGIIAVILCRFDEARQKLMALLAHGESLGLPRLQLGALDNLAMVASYLGHWDEAIDWGERMRPLAQSTGALPDLVGAHLRIAQAAGAAGDHARALREHTDNLERLRITGHRRQEAFTLRMLGHSHLELGRAEVALAWFTQAQAAYQTVSMPLEECENAADMALCLLKLGQPEAARDAVNGLLDRLAGELTAARAHETTTVRWPCHQVLAALGDARAEPLLEQLHADVQARADELTDATDRDRLIQAIPDFRQIVAAYARRGSPGSAVQY